MTTPPVEVIAREIRPSAARPFPRPTPPAKSGLDILLLRMGRRNLSRLNPARYVAGRLRRYARRPRSANAPTCRTFIAITGRRSCFQANFSWRDVGTRRACCGRSGYTAAATPACEENHSYWFPRSLLPPKFFLNRCPEN